MKEKELKQSGVVYNEIEHTYTLNGVQLHGITDVIRRHLFPHAYDDVPAAVLANAAERGKRVHEVVEMHVLGFDVADAPEWLQAFKDVAKKCKIQFVESEFIVTDGERYASPIDIIDSDFNLYDIKTTYSLNKEYVSWQLSIYKYLFHLQNGFEAGKIFAVWIDAKTGSVQLIEVPEQPREEVAKLFQCEADGVQYQRPALQEVSHEMQVEIANLLRAEKEIAEQKKQFAERLTALMAEHAVKTLDCDLFKITYIEETTRVSFDSSKFKKDHPEMVAAYEKTSVVKPTVRITLK